MPVGLNITDAPEWVMGRLGTPNETVAGVFLSFAFILVVCVPILLRGHSGVAFMFFNLLMFLFVGFTWLPAWVALFNVILVCGMYAYGFLRKLWGG